ncbi:MAG TPA: hypothetical protein VKB86_23195 [Pyrinomonadaceae bacterium]|nr:hypothetical protein [Pyrinomonadaceae bacterium]
MNNEELKREADKLIQDCGLSELLAVYPSWFIGGSYSYDLMCWRDLDIYILDPQPDLKRCFEIAYELTQRLSAHKSRFTNNVGGEPSGLYWGIKLGNERQGAWKLDVWFLNRASYDEHAAYSSNMREKLSAESRTIILAIKEDYWRRPEYRDTVTSDMIYRAVLDKGVRSTSEFERLLKENVS